VYPVREISTGMPRSLAGITRKYLSAATSSSTQLFRI